MANGTQVTKNPFQSGERLRECRKWRGMTRAQLVEAVELLPGNNGKTRSEKQIGYIENGTRTLSPEYAHLLADALHVRVEYLMVKDDFRTEIERVEAHGTNRNEKRDLILELIKLHGYEVKDVTDKTPVLVDEHGREYRESAFSLISPRGSERFMKPEDLLQLLGNIDDYVEYQCSKHFRRLIDGVKNVYDWEV